MISAQLRKFLDDRAVKYVTIQHSPAYTAQEIAFLSHVSGRDFAKTVIVKMEHELVMVVLPACRRIMLTDLRELLDCHHLTLATETEFRTQFPDCELGAMPPFGNLYGMRTFVAHELARELEIVFNAGSHSEVIRMAYADWEELVHPLVLDFVVT
jgi:Ala-tRNA(Pro) deacylase